jgi:hypothetical protein
MSFVLERLKVFNRLMVDRIGIGIRFRRKINLRPDNPKEALGVALSHFPGLLGTDNIVRQGDDLVDGFS